MTNSENDIFAHPKEEMVGGLARGGVFWQILMTVFKYAANICTTAVLARILSPDDYGLLAMVATLTAFLLIFSDIGVSWAVIQSKDLTKIQVDNLFWISGLVGAILWSICALGGPFLADFYEKDELSQLAGVMGAVLFLGGLSIQPIALMRRRMQFRILSLVNSAAHLAGGLTGIVLALNGWGYWSLAVQALANGGILLILLFVISSYRPGLPQVNRGTIKLLQFGGYLTACVICIFIFRNLDHILIGKNWGARELGYYSRAYFLMMLPTFLTDGMISNVAVSSLSALQSNLKRMRQAYQQILITVAFLGFPISMGLIVTAPEAIRLVYGPNWLPVVPIFIWLAVGGLFQPIFSTSSWLFLASGNSRLMFLLYFFASLIFVVGFFIGVHWKAKGVAIAYAAIMVFILTFPTFYFSHRSAGLEYLASIKSVLPFFFSGLLIFPASTGVSILFKAAGANWVWVLVGKVLAGAIVYGMVCWRFIRPMPIHYLERVIQKTEKYFIRG
jgi:PST family polysaccharide transporter